MGSGKYLAPTLTVYPLQTGGDTSPLLVIRSGPLDPFPHWCKERWPPSRCWSFRECASFTKFPALQLLENGSRKQVLGHRSLQEVTLVLLSRKVCLRKVTMDRGLWVRQ